MLLQNITRYAENPYSQYGYNNIDAVTTFSGLKTECSNNKYVGTFDKTLGVPKGYSSPYSWANPIKGGGLVGKITNNSDITDALLALGQYINSLIQGVGQLNPTPNLQMIVSLVADLQGVASISNSNLAGVVALIATAYGFGEITSAQLGAIINLLSDITGIGDVQKAQLFGTMVMMGHIYVNEGSASVTQLAEGVWNAIASDYNTTGTMGNKMNSAGSAGDPWASDPSTFTAGTAGAKLNKIAKDVINNQALIVGG